MGFLSTYFGAPTENFFVEAPLRKKENKLDNFEKTKTNNYDTTRCNAQKTTKQIFI